MNRKLDVGIDPYNNSLCLKNLGINPPVNKFEYRDQSLNRFFLAIGTSPFKINSKFLFLNLNLNVCDIGLRLGLHGDMKFGL